MILNRVLEGICGSTELRFKLIRDFWKVTKMCSTGLILMEISHETLKRRLNPS